MISSEVKRTLVKSPPELWTELSDPAALARHLGEFGEIRITRSEPEQLVEWESERASGRVMLKPSGWGTKVTLTVEGELPPNAAPDVPEPIATPESPDLMEPIAPLEPAEPVQAIATPESPDLMQPIAPLEPADPVQAIDPSPAAGATVDHDDDRAVERGKRRGEEQEVELVPPPHSAAAIAAEVAGESRLATFEPRLDAHADAEADLDPRPAIAARPAPEARRGFFARLFGRSTPAAEAPIAEPAPRSDPFPPAIAVPAQGISAPEPAESIPAPEPVQDIPAPEPTQSVPAPEPVQDIRAPEPTQSVPAPEPTQSTPAPEPPQMAAPEEPAPELITPEKPAAEPIESDPMDLAGELQTAEAEAAEQVKLVLTSVLDRLGSAHHRPFSRS